MTEPSKEDTKSAKTNKSFWVTTPWHCDKLIGRGKFPDATPEGVSMSEQEKEAAKAAADGLFIRLSVKEEK